MIGGPAATVPAALISGVIAGAIIGAGQGLALGILRPQALALWVAATALGLGVALEAGWPVFGLSGALVSQVIAGIVLWKVLAREQTGSLAPA
jgi:hypothetical protein